MKKADYGYEDILTALRKLGVQEGDDLFLHSNLGFFGRPEGCSSGEELCALFEKALRTSVGESGTVIVPTYSYSYCRGEIYDPYAAGTTCGSLADYMRRKYPENRTLDPNFSVCGVGGRIQEYQKCNIHESFGTGCFWDMLMEHDGKILCMNVHAASTMVHFIECRNQVGYRYNKAFNGESLIDGKRKKDYAVHFCCDDEESRPDVDRITELCRTGGIMKEESLGKGLIGAYSAKEFFSFFSGLLEKNERALCIG